MLCKPKANQAATTAPSAKEDFIGEYNKVQISAVLRRNDINAGLKQLETPYRVLHRISAKPNSGGASVSFDLYFVEEAQRRCKACLYEDRNIVYNLGFPSQKIAETAIKALNEWLAKPEDEVVETIWRSVGPQCGFGTEKDAEDFIDTLINPAKHVVYYNAAGVRIENATR